MDICCKDIISNLPEALICHILSFLPIRVAALTSLLSKRWRYLFAFVPNLDFDDSGCRPHELARMIFMNFVDRVLVLQGNSAIDRFSLKCNNDYNYPSRISSWISNVIERGVSDLDLSGTNISDHSMHSSVFVSKSLVRLRIETLYCNVIDVFLPKIKTLHLDSVVFGDGDSCLVKLISGCHVLEELVMIDLNWGAYWKRSVSSKTLERLTVRYENWDRSLDSVSFDTPNLVYFGYSDYLANKYVIVNFDSLVEASIGIQMTRDQCAHASHGDLVVNATELFMGISNVQILNVSADTLQDFRWESLPALLNNCPNLETLVFDGLHDKNTVKCVDADRWLWRSSEDIRSCLSSSPVKVLKILNFGEVRFYSKEMEKRKELVKYFLETMPNLEQMILCYRSRIDEDLKSQLERLAPRGASPKCSVQLILENVIPPTYNLFSLF
ncbi:putative F-box/FBD/LRR-repeat protein At3g59240 isoform X2 [Capsella rubella]|uniref:putative F-box/FBD/LRR-repeat protein At3g59240 isoform X2 n=1 Tax=Capsella rubella TaxID=81985 RepID=UPI000CD5A2EB|nr:putative F-box/FBD/LRR-repeat protein At3g59240 isoform X2 [Capsella rubella]